MRDAMTNMCSELMSEVLPLLVPTANNTAGIETEMDCYKLNPEASQPHVQ